MPATRCGAEAHMPQHPRRSLDHYDGGSAGSQNARGEGAGPATGARHAGSRACLRLPTMAGFWAATTLMGITTAIFRAKWSLRSLNLMRASTRVSKRKSGNPLRLRKSTERITIWIGAESMDQFFSRMRANARKLDRGERPAPGLTLSFEDPADFLQVITPARVRTL